MKQVSIIKNRDLFLQKVPPKMHSEIKQKKIFTKNLKEITV